MKVPALVLICLGFNLHMTQATLSKSDRGEKKANKDKVWYHHSTCYHVGEHVPSADFRPR